MRALFCRIAACLSLPGLAAGCSTPANRARQRPAAFRQLSPADQRLVLGGHVRPGLNQAGVYVAWGAPTEIRAGRVVGEPYDCWLYTHTFYGVTGGYYGAPRGLVYSRAEGRYHKDPDDFYEAPVYLRGLGPVSTEVPYRKAYFDGGRVVSFTTLRAGANSDEPENR